MSEEGYDPVTRLALAKRREPCGHFDGTALQLRVAWPLPCPLCSRGLEWRALVFDGVSPLWTEAAAAPVEDAPRGMTFRVQRGTLGTGEVIARWIKA